MATMANPSSAMGVATTSDDPFVNTPPHAHPPPLRYSSFNNDNFTAQSATAPGQAKRALEAHLKETDRRIQDASRLGTALLQQRKELNARIRDVEQHKDDADVGPELQAKLSELEKDYTDLGRESARAFLPKSRLVSSDLTNATQSPSVFAGDSRASPSKVSAPSRRQRNQPSSRVHDIEFATEISTSLLAQVRQLQAVLVEKDDALKLETSERARLEHEVTAYQQRFRHLDENEQKYKDENWNLETQLQEMTSAQKESADRENRLHASLKTHLSDKDAAQRELEDLRQAHEKLADDHSTIKRQHDSEVHILRRDIAGHEHERDGLHKRIEELTAQNTELAKAVAYRWNNGDQETGREVGSDSEFMTADNASPGESPPPSPSKKAVGHGVLETETLKSSLQHAHRMIQNLKNNIHREKTEKIELKRMLQDSRDELEARRGETGMSAAAIAKKRRSEAENAKRRTVHLSQMGAARTSREDIVMDDEWEDHDGQNDFGSSINSNSTTRGPPTSLEGLGEGEEESTDAFETANERDTTDTEAFQTGNEGLHADDSGDATETEGAMNRAGTVKARNSSMPTGLARDRSSFISTASTSADEVEELRTPAHAQQPKYKLKGIRGRRTRHSDLFESNASNASNSPAVSYSSSNRGTPIAAGQSLGAELDALDDDEEPYDGTPSRGSMDSAHSIPEAINGNPANETSKPQMIDSGMMTEPWEPEAKKAEAEEPKSIVSAATGVIGGAVAGITGYAFGSRHAQSEETDHDEPAHAGEPNGPEDAQATEDHESTAQLSHLRHSSAAPEVVPEQFTPLKRSHLRNSSAAPEVVLEQPEFDLSRSETPNWEDTVRTAPAPHQFASIVSQQTEPITPVRSSVPRELEAGAVDSPTSDYSTPRARSRAESAKSQPAMALSSILSQNSEPLEPTSLQGAFPPRRSSRRDPSAKALDTEGGALNSRPSTAEKAGTVLLPFEAATSSRPSSRNREPLGPQIFNDDNAKQPNAASIYGNGTQENLPSSRNSATSNYESSSRAPFSEVSNNAGFFQRPFSDDTMTVRPLAERKVSEQGTQTTVSSEEIDNMLRRQDKEKHGVLPMAAAGAMGALGGAAMVSNGKNVANSSSPRKSSENAGVAEGGNKSIRRAASGGSVRNGSTDLPPLPPDHSQKIAAAAQKVPAMTAGSSNAPGMMGPPMMPASAYKQPQQGQSVRARTPSISQQSPLQRPGAIPRHGGQSSISRRTSVSSFASELDQRFKTQNGLVYPRDIEPATDPRMIQAITQTMIGEYLWKYTRKTGRSEISNSRHRRFFWIHPYTRTLYWSDQDPSTAGSKQLKAKSVAIEAVRVITDDNVDPPGLHRKSIVVITPGREIVFTAPTSQRHETWFNALSYLLMRTAPPEHEMEEGELNNEDVAEFNPQYGRSVSRTTGRSRLSLGSYNSHTSRMSSPRRPHPIEVPSLAQRQASAAEQTANMATPNHQASGRGRSERGSVSGRLSSLGDIFRSPSQFSSRRSRTSMSQRADVSDNGMYSANAVADSAEDLREHIERNEREADRLENVRACCDGKHDVGSLSHRGRHLPIGSGSMTGGLTGSVSSRHTHSHAHPTAEPMSVSSRTRRGE